MDDVLEELRVHGHLQDLLLVLLGDDDLIVLVLLELHGDDVEIDLEHRGLVPLVLLGGTEDAVQGDPVPRGDLSGDVVLHVSRDPLGLGSAPEPLGALLDLDLLRIDVDGGLLIQVEPRGGLVASPFGVVAHQRLLEYHAGLCDPDLRPAPGASEEGMGHPRPDGGDLPGETFDGHELAEVVRPQVAYIDLRVPREIEYPDVDLLAGAIDVGHQGHDGPAGDLETAVRLIEHEHGEIDAHRVDIRIIDPDALLLREVVRDA